MPSMSIEKKKRKEKVHSDIYHQGQLKKGKKKEV